MTAGRAFRRAGGRRPDGPAARLEGRLGDHGLLRRGATDPVDTARRLAAALDGADAAPRAFARWLAARTDLLPLAACRWLAQIPEDADPLPWPLHPSRPEIGLQDFLVAVDPEPAQVRPFRQCYRARTAAGEAVEVVVITPAAAACLTTLGPDADGLDPLADALTAAGLPGGVLLAAFRRGVRLETDLEGEADVLAELGTDAAAFGALVVPRVAIHDGRRLAGPGWLVREALAGRPFEATPDLRGGPTPPTGLVAPLHRAAFVWLRQATLGRAFPLCPAGTGVRWLEDGRVAYTDGPFATLPAASQGQVWSYLLAALHRDPTAAWEQLAPEMASTPGAAAEAEVLLHLRQVVPFRDGSLGEGADPLADELFTVLRVAGERGYEPRRPLAEFARSVFELAWTGLALAPGEALVERAVEELGMERSASELRRHWDPARMAGIPAAYAPLLLELPCKIDEALDLLARGEARVRLELPSRPRRRNRGRWFALAAAAAAVALAWPRLVEMGAPGDLAALGELAAGWGPTALLAAVLLLGLLQRWD